MTTASALFLPLLILALACIEYRARWIETREQLERANHFITREVKL